MHVETDHQPLEMIVQKPLKCAQQLQRMLLQLQKYCLDVHYKRGKETYLADTLDVTEALHAYYDFRDELAVQDQFVFKGPVVIVPATMHKETLTACHATHIGVDGCLQSARESVFWPHMSAELKEYIA